ncbi:MAG: glycosyltransferase, partial [Pseudonocardiaceae bacterium]
ANRIDQPMRILLAGPGWDDPARAGMHLHDARLGIGGRVQLRVVPDYLDSGHRKTLVAATDLAAFPYQPHPSFQGSGAIADYLAGGVPVLATAVANMAELIADAGAVVLPRDPDALADHLCRLTGMNGSTERARAAASRRAGLFTAEHHARQCAALYEQAIAHARVEVRR